MDKSGREAAEALVEKDGYALRVRSTGYIQFIDPEYVLTLAREHDLVIRLLRKPGHFVWREAVVALVWPAAQVDEELEEQIRHAFPAWKQAHTHPGCRLRGQPARRNGGARHVSGDQ